jgi:hypothetical protein
MILIVSYPTMKETRAAAKAGNQRAIEELPRAMKVEARARRAKNRELKEATQLPDLPGDSLVIDWDFEAADDDSWTVLRHEGAEIWRELAYYEGYKRFERVVEILRERYGSKLKEVRPTPASEGYLYGDRLGSVDVVAKVIASLKEGETTTDDGRRSASNAMEESTMDAMRPQLSTEEAWEHVANELSVAMADLDEDEYLVLSRKGTNYYVQLMDQGSFGVRAEAVSNAYVNPNELLTDESKAKLLELGWTGPTHRPGDEIDESGRHKAEGSPNFYLDLAKPIAYRELADLMVTTLRDVYRTEHPGWLEYQASSTRGMSIRFPHLGIRRKPSK